MVTWAPVLEEPNISVLVERLRTVSVYYRMESELVDVPNIVSAIQHIQLYPEELALIHAMGGCKGVPATRNIPGKVYLQALLEHRGI